MTYHQNDIKKGVIGEVTKITEEYEEFIDSVNQNCIIMQLIELSDLLGAIEAYTEKYNITLHDLIKMKEITKRVFLSGRR